MVQRKLDHGYTAYTIVSDDGQCSATFIPERGGVGSSIVMQGSQGPRELLFLAQNFWEPDHRGFAGGWPFCFPICGRLERQGESGLYLYDGQLYELPIHGFASQLPWSIDSDSSNERQLSLLLQANEDTQNQYPFNFEIALRYTISHNELLCSQTYRNAGNHPMPFYAGFHPYFLTPPVNQGKEKVILNYHPIRRFRYNENLTDLIGEGKLFDLPSAITNPALNEQLTQLGTNHHLQLRFPDGDVLHLHADGIEDPNLFNYVQLYTDPLQAFFCLEPWMAFPNALNSVWGVKWLKAGAALTAQMRLRLANTHKK